MIYISADDYGLCDSVSEHIQKCIDKGALNKVSIFPNIDTIDLTEISENKNIMLCLHLNLVEGKCMADEADLIADKNGNLKHTFGGLLKLSIFHSRKFEEQVYKEIKAQVLFWKSILPDGVHFCIDSHQHTHMIPSVFKAMTKVLNDEKIDLKYIRIPSEPLMPYITTPSLYLTYSPVNIIKQWLLKFLWSVNKRRVNICHTAYFMGILFSGKMDEKRVSKILPKYKKLAEKNGRDIEVLFHPGYLDKTESNFKNKNIVFRNFYLSENRKTEFNSVMNISERSVQ